MSVTITGTDESIDLSPSVSSRESVFTALEKFIVSVCRDHRSRLQPTGVSDKPRSIAAGTFP